MTGSTTARSSMVRRSIPLSTMDCRSTWVSPLLAFYSEPKGAFSPATSILGMRSEDLATRIASFDRWHYEFDLDGIKTPIADATRVNRHQQRFQYFFEPLVRLFGGSLTGKRILDLGCNAGFWSLKAVEANAEFVLGIDARQMHVDQADLVFEVKGIDAGRYEFTAGNIFHFDLESYGDFDIVLNLGLMYHVSKHVDLVEKIAAVNSDLMVVDTAIAPLPGSYLKIRFESVDKPRDAVDYELVMTPSQRAVHDITGQFGYRTVTLKPRFTDWTGSGEYRCGRRRAFVCAKQTNLDGLDVATEPVRTRIGLSDLAWATRTYVVNARRKLFGSS
jgi:tRNA (mo5U34)-methyltransferase